MRWLFGMLVAVTAGVVIALLPSSLRAPLQGPLASPPDSACAGRTHLWASSGAARPSALDDMAVHPNAALSGDSVRLTSASFSPGNPSQVVWGGLLRNGTSSTIEIRSYHVEYLSAAGDVVGTSTCRVSMGGEQCGVHGTNLKRPGEIALITDTLKGAPPAASRDTARIFWSYCVAAAELRQR